MFLEQGSQSDVQMVTEIDRLRSLMLQKDQQVAEAIQVISLIVYILADM